MIVGIQLVGMIFCVVMMYFVFVNYKRHNYGPRSLVLWLSVWLGAIILISFPKTVYGVMEALKIQRTADFITLLGFAFFAAIIFYLYTTVKKNNYKIEQLVRQLAINEKEKKKKRKKGNDDS